MVELLVTLVVTTMGMIGLVSLGVATMNGNGMVNRNAEATAIAQSTMEELRAMPVPDMLLACGCPDPLTCLAASAVLDTVYGRLSVSGSGYDRLVSCEEMTTVSSSLLRVRVDVSWTDIGSAATEASSHAIALELLRTRVEPL